MHVTGTGIRIGTATDTGTGTGTNIRIGTGTGTGIGIGIGINWKPDSPQSRRHTRLILFIKTVELIVFMHFIANSNTPQRDATAYDHYVGDTD